MNSLNICGAGPSGSTLLGLMAGSHSACVYLGEAARIKSFDKADWPEQKRACQICGPACATNLESRGRPRPDVVIDSSKHPWWKRRRVKQTRNAGWRPHLALPTRDGRAVINSRLRKYPTRDAEQEIRDWMRAMTVSERLYDAFPGPKSRLRYEDLATQPKRSLGATCQLLDLAYEPAMLRFQHGDHHPLGGNSGTNFQVARTKVAVSTKTYFKPGIWGCEYYERHDESIRLDLRWTRELDPAHQALFERSAGSFNASMAWDG
jgi:hypothetical protein